MAWRLQPQGDQDTGASPLPPAEGTEINVNGSPDDKKSAFSLTKNQKYALAASGAAIGLGSIAIGAPVGYEAYKHKSVTSVALRCSSADYSLTVTRLLLRARMLLSKIPKLPQPISTILMCHLDSILDLYPNCMALVSPATFVPNNLVIKLMNSRAVCQRYCCSAILDTSCQSRFACALQLL